MMERNGAELDLPGFRFHPTEEELLDFYLKRAAHGKKLNVDIIGTLNLYRYDPWLLPELAKIGEREWYFFVPRDRKQANGGRPNRTTERGFWKATGSDRPIRSAADPKRLLGLKKTLVFYQGRAPRGSKTDWVMNEYRLPDTATPAAQEDVVLCKVYRKATSLKELEQRAATEDTSVSSSSSSDPDQVMIKDERCTACLPACRPAVILPEIQVPPKQGLEWMQDPFLTQLRSPWLDQWSPYASLLNF